MVLHIRSLIKVAKKYLGLASNRMLVKQKLFQAPVKGSIILTSCEEHFQWTQKPRLQSPRTTPVSCLEAKHEADLKISETLSVQV